MSTEPDPTDRTDPTGLTGLSEAVRARGGELRAGGTDTGARQRSGVSTGPFTDLDGAAGLRGTTLLPDGGLRIGALTTLAALAANPQVRAGWPTLAVSAGTAATPQIRAAGTLGGNLLQRNRCWYFRNPHVSCLQKGGAGCPAREGDHHFGVVSGAGPCITPHPSTLAMALLTYDAEAEIHDEPPRSVADLYGDGDRLHQGDHLLPPHRILTAVRLPAPCPANAPPATGPPAGPTASGPWSRPPPGSRRTGTSSRTSPSRRAGWRASRCGCRRWRPR